MGTPGCAIPVLKKIIDTGHNIVGVITQPDMPKGRKQVLEPCPVKQFSLVNNLPVYTPKSIRKDTELIKVIRDTLKPDIIVVVAFGQILPSEVLNIPSLGCINLHFSLLPKYRGAAPVSWAIINGDKDTGVSIMYLNEKMDEGDIILQDKVDIRPEDTRDILETRLSVIGADLIEKVLPRMESGHINRLPQNHQEATYAPKLITELGKLDWNKPACEVDCLIRGLNPDPVAYAYYKSERIRVLSAQVIEQNENPKQLGEIIAIIKGSESGILVQTVKDCLLLKEIQPDGKKIMKAFDFANGRRLVAGDRFD
jgi:methionyl-tRNA formyltransferase